MKLAFLASNSGSSMRAIVGAIDRGELDAEAVLAVSNRRDATALLFAAKHGLATRFIPTLKDSQAADDHLRRALEEARADLVILSGYLRKLGPAVLAAFGGRVLNIHPALLPNYGGEGMYGRRVHEAVIAAGETVSGATVHLVDERYDHGPVVARAIVPVLAADTAADLERRVMAAEPGLYISTLQAIAAGSIQLPGVFRPHRQR